MSTIKKRLAVVAAVVGTALVTGGLLAAYKNELGESPVRPVIPSVELAQQAEEDGKPMSASLLRRLAEAAAGFPDISNIWIVMDPEPPHDMLGLYYMSREEAERERNNNAPSYGVYGPFTTQNTLRREIDVYFMACKNKWTEYTCRPGEPIGWRSDEIDSLKILLFSGADTATERTFRGDSIVEAIVFGPRAYDRFMFPYNIRVFGAARANAMRDSIFTELREIR
jgi:hypothetical protein